MKKQNFRCRLEVSAVKTRPEYWSLRFRPANAALKKDQTLRELVAVFNELPTPVTFESSPK
jgi:hypothetical protein